MKILTGKVKERIKMKEALILFSGGKDSFLSALKTLEKGYTINLITFQNGMELNTKNILVGAKRIQKKFGTERVNIIGIKYTDAIWRELICEFYNYNSEYIVNHFENITISQFNCLSCRLAMYIVSIIICKQNKISYVVDGARKCQLFAIEQPDFLTKFEMLFNENNIKIEYPLANENNDFIVKNEILARGFVPKMNEAQCLLGMPVTENGMSKEILGGLMTVYEKYLYPKAKDILNRYKYADFGESYF